MKLRVRERRHKEGRTERVPPQAARRAAFEGAAAASDTMRRRAEETTEEYLSEGDAAREVLDMAQSSKGRAALMRLTAPQTENFARFVLWAMEDSGDTDFSIHIPALKGTLHTSFERDDE